MIIHMIQTAATQQSVPTEFFKNVTGHPVSSVAFSLAGRSRLEVIL